MEADKQLYKLFTAAPAQLYQLLGLPAPQAVRARAEAFKDVQTESDLVLEPAEDAEPARLAEFQGYRDPRGHIARCIDCNDDHRNLSPNLSPNLPLARRRWERD